MPRPAGDVGIAERSAITAWFSQHLGLQLSEGGRELREGRAVPQRPWLTLDDGEVVPPVIDRSRRQGMTTLDQPFVFTQDLPLGGNNDPLGIDPQADGSVRKGRGNAVAIALKADQARR
jgi:hypothetical protein